MLKYVQESKWNKAIKLKILYVNLKKKLFWTVVLMSIQQTNENLTGQQGCQIEPCSTNQLAQWVRTTTVTTCIDSVSENELCEFVTSQASNSNYEQILEARLMPAA